jgi:hypothetical protein
VRRRRGQTYLLVGTVVYTVTTFVLSSVFGDVLSNVLTAGGRIGLVLVAAAALGWLAVGLPAWRRQLRERRLGEVVPGAQRVPRSLTADAEAAERWLVGLGSDTSGMAAAEWFEAEEPRLRRLVAKYAASPAAADALATICDALDAWYVRQRRPADLLELAERLAALADHAGRRDLKEVAAARAATAHRLAGDLDAATRELGRSAELAARGPTAASVRARREVEWALSNLARADASAPGADLAEHLACAQDRLADAAAALPRADLAGDTAIHLNLGLVALYRQDTDTALDHLGLAAARALTTRDVDTQAHAHELAGVVAWSQDNPREAVAWWRHAERLYSDVADREGRARCLQHLGSAALRSASVATLLRHTDEAASGVARRLLEESARLRTGSQGHLVLEYYLRLAGDGVGGGEPVVDRTVPLRRAWRRFTRRLLP